MEVEVIRDPQAQLRWVLISTFHPQCISLYPACDMRILVCKPFSLEQTLCRAHEVSSSALGGLHA